MKRNNISLQVFVKMKDENLWTTPNAALILFKRVTRLRHVCLVKIDVLVFDPCNRGRAATTPGRIENARDSAINLLSRLREALESNLENKESKLRSLEGRHKRDKVRPFT